MKTLPTLTLAALLAMTGCSVKIKGEWSQDHPGQFQASTELHQGDLYRIHNSTAETITVWLLDDRTPIDYFPLLPGQSQDFTAPGDSFDLYTGGSQTVQGVSLWWIPGY